MSLILKSLTYNKRWLYLQVDGHACLPGLVARCTSVLSTVAHLNKTDCCVYVNYPLNSWKCYFPIKPHVRLLVGRSVGRPVSCLVSYTHVHAPIELVIFYRKK